MNMQEAQTRNPLTFYTVLCDQKGYPVKFIDPLTLRMNRFVGSFDDPGEASQEFQACVSGENGYYLDESQFAAKARALAKIRRNREQHTTV